MPNPNYSLRSDFEIEEEKRMKREQECPHDKWITRCSRCSKILACDHHINVHTQKDFKEKNSVALLIFEEPTITPTFISRLAKLRQHYDQLIVIVDQFDQWQMLSELKLVWRVSYETPITEVKNQLKYRKTSIQALDMVLYPDTNSQAMQEASTNHLFYKKNNVTIKIHD